MFFFEKQNSTHSTKSKSIFYKKALQHKSYNTNFNNERLEFLGDSILNYIVSEYMFFQKKEKSEGYLSKQRASIVGRKHLNKVGKNLINKNDIKTKLKTLPENIYGNTLEAIIGAIYVSEGIEKTKKFVLENIIKSDFIEEFLDSDYKSELQEVTQKQNKKIKYVLSEASGPAHNKEFEVKLYNDNKEVANNKGFSIKEAEQKAAQQALKSVF